jgi:hypothetical protein
MRSEWYSQLAQLKDRRDARSGAIVVREPFRTGTIIASIFRRLAEIRRSQQAYSWQGNTVRTGQFAVRITLSTILSQKCLERRAPR